MEVVCINRTKGRISIQPIRQDIRDAIAEMRRQHWAERLPPVLTVVFLSDRESRILNQRFRHTPLPANVLSFHYGHEGEIMVAPAIIRRQAKARGLPYARELRRMVIHGLMHLMGRHHEPSRSAEMRFNRAAEHLERYLRIRAAGPPRGGSIGPVAPSW